MTQDARHIESCRGIVKFFDNAIRNIALYPPDHPSVKGVVKRLYEYLSQLLAAKEEIPLGVINGVLYVDDYLFYEPTPFSDHVLKDLSQFKVDDLVFRRGVQEKELLALAALFKAREGGREVFVEDLKKAQLQHVSLKSFSMGKEEGSELPTVGLETYRDAITTMQGFFGEVGSGQLPPMREAENLVEGFMANLASNRSLLMVLSSLKGYDTYTYQHCVNVGILAMLLAEFEGMDERSIKWAALAGMMHDIGKVRVPSEVVNKPGGLTLREWEAMKAHPVHSADVVRGMGGAEELAMAVEGHHMHHDGGGYPVRTDTGGPTDLARLVAVVDSYDAITTVRSYKRPMDPVEAMAYLESGRGSRFDPRHVDSLISMVGAYPPGAMVRLTSNEVGIVVAGGKKTGRPVLKMVVDGSGRPFSEPWELDLSGEKAEGRLVAAVVTPGLYEAGASAHLVA